MVDIQGYVAAGFEPVERVFRENFLRRGEVGAAVCAFVEGQPVVDLWAGRAERGRRARPWTPDTLAVVFSSTKGLTALCFLLLVDRGLLELDRPVADYWPEFGVGVKARITVRQLLNHRSGLSALESPLRLEDLRDDPEKVQRALVAQEPMWEPGAQQGYGAIAWGLYAGELFRRVAGRSVGNVLASEVAEPLGAQVYLGLPAPLEPLAARMLPVQPLRILPEFLPELMHQRTPEGRAYRALVADKGSYTARAFRSAPSLGKGRLERLNEPAVHRLELPWMNALASARGLAKVYRPLAEGGSFGGVRLVRPETIAPVMERQSWAEPDVVLHKPLGYSQGFCKDETHLVSPHTEAFGHTGMGGSVGFCDPPRRLAFGYVMNKMSPRIRSPRCIALCRAIYACLGSIPFDA